MYIKLKNITIHIGFSFAVIFAVGMNFADVKIYLISLLSSLFHECMHLLALKLSGCDEAVLDFRFGAVKLTASGFSRLSYNRTIFCTLSAPVMNIFAGAVCALLYHFFRKDIFFGFSAVNFILGIINLLPVSFLDGGMAINSFLGKYLEEEALRKCSFFLSFFSVFLLFLLFFVAFIKGQYYLFFLFFFIYCLLGFIGDAKVKVRDVFS